MKEFKFLKYHGLSSKVFYQEMVKEGVVNESPPVDIHSILKHLDVEVDESFDIDRLGTVGSISLDNNGPRVWANPIENNYEPRRRFTLAHELGHLILHITPDSGVREFIDNSKTLSRKESYWDSKEYEANNFAAGILMPAALIKKEGNQVVKNYLTTNESGKMPASYFVEKMKELFCVSEPAMKYRLKNLGVFR